MAGAVIAVEPSPRPQTADLLFVLAGDAGVEGPVPAVVRAGGEFVHQQLAVDDEQLDGQHTDVQRVRDRHRQTDRPIGDLRRHRRRDRRDIKDAGDMAILGDLPRFHIARRRPTDDDAQLGLECETLLDHAGDAQLGPRGERLATPEIDR